MVHMQVMHHGNVGYTSSFGANALFQIDGSMCTSKDIMHTAHKVPNTARIMTVGTEIWLGCAIDRTIMALHNGIRTQFN